MHHSRNWRRLANAGMAALFITIVPLAEVQAAQECSLANASPAGKIRRLQTFMMVAALKCRERKDLGLPGKYNVFIKRYNGELQKTAAVLMSQFKQLYGGDHQRQIDSFITTLANDAARQSVWFEDWCDQMSSLGDTLTSGHTMLLDAADRLPSKPIPDGGAQIGCATSAALPSPTLTR